MLGHPGLGLLQQRPGLWSELLQICVLVVLLLFCRGSAFVRLPGHKKRGLVSLYCYANAKMKQVRNGKTYNRNLDNFAGGALAPDACSTTKQTALKHVRRTARTAHKSPQLTGNFRQTLPEPPGSQSQQQEEEDHAKDGKNDWRHQQTNRPHQRTGALEITTRRVLVEDLNYRFLRRRMGSVWGKPGTVQRGTGPVSDTPCWTRGYTSPPPPHLLYTCKFIKNKTKRRLSASHPDIRGLIVEDVRRSLGTAFADLAGLIWDTERPQFALAPGV